MSDAKTQLRDLHRLHLRAKDLREEVEAGPNKLRRFQAKIDLQQKQLDDHHEALKHLKVAVHEKEVSIKDIEAKITRHQSQLNTATTRKEYDALRHEIDNEKQATRAIEDEILELMMQLDDESKQIPVLEKSLQAARDEHAKEKERIANTQAGLEARLKETKEQLAEAEKALTPEPLQLYNRLVQQRGHDSLAPVENQSCTGCYTALTAQNQQDLRIGRTLACKSCGRLLYLPE